MDSKRKLPRDATLFHRHTQMLLASKASVTWTYKTTCASSCHALKMNTVHYIPSLLSPPEMSDVSRRRATTTRIHIMALDGIVNVNSLFTLALFVGMTTTANTDTSLVSGDTECAAGPSVAEGLISSHVYSFSCFLFSSLIALALKNAINMSKSFEDEDALDHGGIRRALVHGAASLIGEVNTVVLRVGILVSAFGSVFGCGFLVKALVDLVQIKLGVLGCGSSRYTYAAIGPLLVLVPTALLIYVVLVLYAFTR